MIRALFVVGGAAVLLSCGSNKPACGPTSCSLGCCDASGACVTTGSSQACGSAGNSCVACLLGQVCTLGACRGGNNVGGGSGSGGGSGTGGGGALCKPSTCSGCCDSSDTCHVNPTAAACGIGGSSCVACNNGDVCSTAGSCQSGTGGGGGSATGGGAATGGGSATGGGGASDGGTGGGGAACSGTLVQTTAAANHTWFDIAFNNAGQCIVEDGSLECQQNDAGFNLVTMGCNNGGGHNRSIWSTRDGLLFVAGQNNGVRTYDSVNHCQGFVPANTFQSNSVIRRMDGLEEGSGVELYFGDDNGDLWVMRGDAGITKTHVNNGNWRTVDVFAGTNVTVVFVAGDDNGSPAIYRYDRANGTWSPEVFSAATMFTFDALSIYDETTAYAAGGNHFYRWDGGSWGPVGISPPFNVNDLLAVGPDQVFAVGGSKRQLAYFDGNSWSDAGTYSGATGDELNVVKGSGACDLWLLQNTMGAPWRSGP